MGGEAITTEEEEEGKKQKEKEDDDDEQRAHLVHLVHGVQLINGLLDGLQLWKERDGRAWRRQLRSARRGGSLQGGGR